MGYVLAPGLLPLLNVWTDRSQMLEITIFRRLVKEAIASVRILIKPKLLTSALSMITKAGVSASKVAIGITSYGRSF